jgi:Rieske Fe-S protein
MADAPASTGPDFTQGIELSDIPEGGLGNSNGEAVLLIHHGGDVFALAATCTHYGGPLAGGILSAGVVLGASIAEKSCLVAFRTGGRIAAVASIYRDRESLRAEASLERGDQAGLEALLASAGT